MAIQRKPKRSTPSGDDSAVQDFITGTARTPQGEEKTRAKKTPVTMKLASDLLARIDQAAARAGVSRTAWISMMASDALKRVES